MDKQILYAQAVFGDEEKQAVMAALASNWLASGVIVEEFEQAIAKLFNKKYALAVNSGSSANLLALTAVHLPKRSEIITPACTFATTVAPIIQCDLLPVFVDCVIGKYTIDVSLVEQAITPKTKAIFVPQLIGSIANMKVLRDIADRHSLYLIEDSCDTISPASSYADITTTSFYGSHIITTMGSGGMFMTDNKDLYDRAKLLINWGRAGDEEFEKRFNFKIDGIPFDSQFVYQEVGFNMKMTEAQAAFGLEQLKRLPKFIDTRNKNFEMLLNYFKKYKSWFYLPEAGNLWLAFPLTIKKHAPFDRYAFLKHLDSNGVQIRVLFAGNITRHPAYRRVAFRKASTLDNSDEIMRSGFLIGCHQGLTDEDIDKLINICEEFLSKYEN